MKTKELFSKRMILSITLIILVFLSIGLVLGEGIDCSKNADHPSCKLKTSLSGSNTPTEDQWKSFIDGKVGDKNIDVADELSKMVSDGTLTVEKSKTLVELLNKAEKDGGLNNAKTTEIIKGLGKSYATATGDTSTSVKNVANTIMSNYLQGKGNKNTKFDFGSYTEETGLKLDGDKLVLGDGDKKVTFATTNLPDDVTLTAKKDGEKMYAITSSEKGGKKFESKNTGDDVVQKMSEADLKSLPANIKTENFEFWKVDNVDGKQKGFVAVGYSKIADGKDGSVTVDGSKITTTGIANTKIITDEKNRVSILPGKSDKPVVAEIKNDDTLTLVSGGDSKGAAKVVKTVDGVSVSMEYKNDAGNEKGAVSLLTGEYTSDLNSKKVIAMKKNGDALELSGDLSDISGGSLKVEKPDGVAVKGSLQCGKTSYSTDTTLTGDAAKGKSVIWSGAENNQFFEVKNGNVNVASTVGTVSATTNGVQAQNANVFAPTQQSLFQKVDDPRFGNVYTAKDPTTGDPYYFVSNDGENFYRYGIKNLDELKVGDNSKYIAGQVYGSQGDLGSSYGPASGCDDGGCSANGGCYGGSCGGSSGSSGGRFGYVPGQPVRNVLRGAGNVVGFFRERQPVRNFFREVQPVRSVIRGVWGLRPGLIFRR